MPAFVESELQHVLWEWFEQNHTVYPEVSIETGRIDLLVETADSEIWGIEVKGTSTATSDIQQVDKYVQDPALDRVYYASNTIEQFKSATDTKGTQFSMDYDEMYRALSGANQLLKSGTDEKQITEAMRKNDERLPTVKIKDNRDVSDCIVDLPDFGWPEEKYNKIAMNEPTLTKVSLAIDNAIDWFDSVHKSGIIHVPVSISKIGQFEIEINEPLDNILSNNINQPSVIREARPTDRTTRPTPTSSEINLQHTIWAHTDGITEAAIPNPNPSHSNTLNIDFIQFNNAQSAPEVMRDGGEVIGIEIKTENSVGQKRLFDQIRRYIEAGSLTSIYVAVPEEATKKLESYVDQNDVVDPSVIGIIGIGDDGFDIFKDGECMQLQHDAYGYEEYPYQIGYGNATVSEIPTPSAIYTDGE